jgi:uncharacterized protein
MDPVVHFELPALDTERMADFYTGAFGWNTDILGPEMGGYVLVTTTKKGKDGFPVERGQINGGLFKKNDGSPIKYPSLAIAVTDIKDSMKKVKEVGGEVFGEPVMIPGTGLYVVFSDTEGNRLSMIQPDPM